jgi:hypothetical protein
MNFSNGNLNDGKRLLPLFVEQLLTRYYDSFVMCAKFDPGRFIDLALGKFRMLHPAMPFASVSVGWSCQSG